MASTLFVKFASSLGNVDTLIIIFGTKLFILGEGGTLSLGILYSVFGIGAVLGPVLLGRYNDGSLNRMRWLIAVSFSWVALAWVALGGAQSLVVACIGLFVRAMGGSANWTYSSVILQKTTDDSFLGRVLSLDWTLFYVSTVFSTIMHGLLIDQAGGQSVVAAATVTFVLALISLGVWVATARWLAQRPVAQAA